jgi:ribonuclease P protein component
MAGHDFPKSSRIGPKPEIDRVFKKGRTFTGALIRIHILANRLERSRMAVSAPRKVGGAVQRNRWKRLVREAFRLNRNGVGPGLDLVFVPRVPPAGVGRELVEDELLAAVCAYRRVNR